MGRGSTDTLGGGAVPKIYAVEAWDGKDGQVSGSSTEVLGGDVWSCKCVGEVFKMNRLLFGVVQCLHSGHRFI